MCWGGRVGVILRILRLIDILGSSGGNQFGLFQASFLAFPVSSHSVSATRNHSSSLPHVPLALSLAQEEYQQRGCAPPAIESA